MDPTVNIAIFIIGAFVVLGLLLSWRNYRRKARESKRLLAEFDAFAISHNLAIDKKQTLNKNMIADEPRTAMDPSGIRFGTPAMTTRGMKETEAARLAELMIDTLRAKDDGTKKAEIRQDVKLLAEAFPIPDSFV